jgi:hypothetical protein
VSLEGLDESAVLVCIGHFEMHSIPAFSADNSRVLEHDENERVTTSEQEAGGHHHHHHHNAQAHERCCGVASGVEVEDGLDLSDHEHEHDGDVVASTNRPITSSDAAAVVVTKPSAAPPVGWLRRERKAQPSDDSP